MRRGVAWTAVLGALVVLVAFGVGRVATDRWHATQYLRWAPGVPVVIAGVVCLAVSAVAWRRSISVRRCQRSLGVTIVLATAWVVLVDWRIANWLSRGPDAVTPGTFRIVHFNASTKPVAALPAGVLELDPDLVAFVNLNGRSALVPTLDRLSQPRGDITAQPSLVHAGRCSVVSRARIVAFGETSLGFEGRVFLNRTMPDLRDHGTAAWFRLDTTPLLGRELVVWVLDLPGDPGLGRRRVMTQTMDVISAWDGPEMRREEGGNYAVRAREPESPRGFPAPDVIVGDFNTPGGSAAIAELARRAGGGSALRDAHAEAGLGPDATFPGYAPRWMGLGIDRGLVAGSLDTLRYDVVPMGSAQHRAQRVIVRPRSGPSARGVGTAP